MHIGKPAVFVAAALTAGCVGSANFIAPEPIGDQTRSYQDEYEQVWSEVVTWFSTNGIPIKNIEKDSGLITSEKQIERGTSVVDCGRYDVDPIGGAEVTNYGTIDISVLVREKNGEVAVTPSVFGNGGILYLGNFDTEAKKPTGRCESTGQLEQQLHSYLEKNL